MLKLRGGSAIGVESYVTQGNITINFESPTQVVQNFLGDHFIKTPVTVSNASAVGIGTIPVGTGATKRHGAMINPNDTDKQGFDGRMTHGATDSYDESLSITFPRAMNDGESLLCSVSYDPNGSFSSSGNPSCVDEIQTFTFVSTLPDENAFRPARTGSVKTIYNLSDCNFGLLPGLTPPADVPTPIGVGASHWQLNDPLQGSPHLWHHWFNGTHNTELSGGVPASQQYWYRGVMHSYANRIAVYTMMNYSDKLTYAKRLIQMGIDYYGMKNMGNGSVTGNPIGWAHGAGYGGTDALPILYAGWLLEDTNFKDYVIANASKFSHDYQFYYSSTPYSGYASGYPAAWGVHGPQGDDTWPLFGDNNGPPGSYGVNTSTRDFTHNRYNASGGVGSDSPYDEGSQYQAVDGTCTHYITGGSYMSQNALKAYGGGRIWSYLAGQDANWGSTAWIDFFDWLVNDYNNILGAAQASIPEAYVYGGSSNGFLTAVWRDYGY